MEGREKILIVLVVNPVNPELTSGQRRVSNDFAFEEISGPALAFARQILLASEKLQLERKYVTQRPDRGQPLRIPRCSISRIGTDGGKGMGLNPGGPNGSGGEGNSAVFP
ncbi:hypothetical protein AXG93_2752s2020 [Marchantia polymorpha subsp. ruderalis]|uniref:Uncharacterized protein n=1 Tax=Marchantia polymorpha subsp. ruderalis TaxID=1480154 RepID=A0A176VWD0_MARPO|nr:hypothetical protein AXG93_2752s2020 [Marchantia polymorpha subsp. ruderalis]